MRSLWLTRAGMVVVLMLAAVYALLGVSLSGGLASARAGAQPEIELKNAIFTDRVANSLR